MAVDWERLNKAQLHAFGVSVTYQRAAGGPTVQIKVINGDPAYLPAQAPGQYIVRWTSIESFGTTPPVEGDYVLIGFEKYSVFRIHSEGKPADGGGGGVTLVLSLTKF